MPVKEKKSLGPNPFLYPLPVLLVGTYDATGKANIMTAAWGGICGSDPLCLSVSIRPGRWTHKPILERKAFTVSIPTEKLLAQADYAGMASGAAHDKFAKAGLTAVPSRLVDAPYVGECPVVLECSLLQSVELGAHTMMIGRIEDVRADTGCLTPDGEVPDLAAFSPILYDAASRSYYGVGKRLAQAFSAGKALL